MLQRNALAEGSNEIEYEQDAMENQHSEACTKHQYGVRQEEKWRR